MRSEHPLARCFNLIILTKGTIITVISTRYQSPEVIREFVDFGGSSRLMFVYVKFDCKLEDLQFS